MNDYAIKEYVEKDCVVFCSSRDPFGGLHNMAGGYIIRMGDIEVRSSEHLYQVMRFPDHPDIQTKLLAIPSPYGAKMFGRQHADKMRPDFDDFRIEIMEWALDLKFLNNPTTFGDLIKSTDDKHIVEYSTKGDTFWGTVRVPDRPGILRGANVLGTLLVLLRRKVGGRLTIKPEPHIPIPNFLFLGMDAISLAKGGIHMSV
jgi:predicted NAD-dependent protein-ADP-ribosyltransferase YbiA (DUF1768 family)